MNNPLDGSNLVTIVDKGFYPDYYLFCFHQGELGVHIPCKSNHPNVTVTLIHRERLNQKSNYDVKRGNLNYFVFK
jgi:hypothetical protein